MTDHVLAAVGGRLRDLRQAAGLTLAQVSEQTAISVSTLSRLESAQRKPTLELLLPLSAAYGVALDELVTAPAGADPRVPQRPFTRHGMTFVPLSRGGSGLQAYKQTIPGRTVDTPITQGVHAGYDWMYVLSGRLRLVLGDHDLVLGPGEVAEFDTRVPHGFASAGPEPVEVLSLFGRQGERVHVRATTLRDPVTSPPSGR